MSVLVSKTKNEIVDCVVKAAQTAISKGLLPEAELTKFSIEVPSQRDHGDYAVNAAMVWSKLFRNAPRNIATILM